MPRLSHSSWFYHTHTIRWGVQAIKFLVVVIIIIIIIIIIIHLTDNVCIRFVAEFINVSAG
jgi:hypothetical protein